MFEPEQQHCILKLLTGTNHKWPWMLVPGILIHKLAQRKSKRFLVDFVQVMASNRATSSPGKAISHKCDIKAGLVRLYDIWRETKRQLSAPAWKLRYL